MVKVLGALLMVVAPVYLSLTQYRTYEQQSRLLAAFSKMLEEMTAQIRCNLTTVPSIAAAMERRGPPLAQFWREIRCDLEKNTDSLEEIWRAALEKTALPGEAQEILTAVPQALQFYSAEEIVSALQNMIRELEDYRAETRRDFEKNFKAHTGIRLSSALFLLILLV